MARDANTLYREYGELATPTTTVAWIRGLDDEEFAALTALKDGQGRHLTEKIAAEVGLQLLRDPGWAIMQVYRPQKGDLLVIHANGWTTDKMARLGQGLHMVLPDIQVMVVEEGVVIEVVRPESDAATT